VARRLLMGAGMCRDVAPGEASLRGLDVSQDECRFGDEPPTSKGGRTRTARTEFVAEASIVILRAEDVLLARTAAEVLCEQLLGDSRRRELVLHAISELGKNILEHAEDGTIALASVRGARTGLEIFAHDRGPGIECVAEHLLPRRVWSMMPEPGLRGIKRTAHEFDIDTSPRGTHVRVVFYR
jgi:serine/threonine-protein kinase RsbT